jgi:hypothetical protein
MIRKLTMAVALLVATGAINAALASGASANVNPWAEYSYGPLGSCHTSGRPGYAEYWYGVRDGRCVLQ